MDEKKIIKHYNRRLRAFRVHHRMVSTWLGMEGIHKMRVDIKRLRAVLSLMEIASKQKFKKKEHFQLFKALFRTAGKVREAQINEQLFAKIDKGFSETYGKALSKKMEYDKGQLREALGSYDLARFEELNAAISEFFVEISDEEIWTRGTKHLISILKKVNKTPIRPGKDKKLHQIRIQLKEAQELLIILNNLKRGGPLQDLSKPLDNLTKRIGTWHDDTVLDLTLEHYASGLKDKNQLVAIKRILKTIRKRREQKRKKIKKNLRKTISTKKIKILEQGLKPKSNSPKK